MTSDTSPSRPVTLDDMISHDEVLERYAWMSGHILNRWRRERRVRSFTGKAGAILYPKSDLDRALAAELGEDAAPQHTPSPVISDVSDRPAGMSEADAIRERLFIESITSRKRKPRRGTGSPEAEEMR